MGEGMDKAMVNIHQNISLILRLMQNSLSELENQESEELVAAIRNNRRILLFGMGRSGLNARIFALRMVNMGYNALLLGETIIPPIKPHDLLIVISGSGKTPQTIDIAQSAKKYGVKVVAITSFRKSKLAKLADMVVYVPGRIKEKTVINYYERQMEGLHQDPTTLGSLFELNTQLYIDALIMALFKEKRRSAKRRK
ncbi:6-phospho-3-hexuloisomerase [Candidatus Woesearchaeota archaeon CG_4_10_14_0_8_um_filter_47_5]|nr:MAG: 6-phospho-3-hexuloisomerase [Candidatus Woesearchaeota archaeon CG_4_10_14_0_8_um_filter_47_5]